MSWAFAVSRVRTCESQHRCFPARSCDIFFPDDELRSILVVKLKQEYLTAGEAALKAATNVLARRRATAAHFRNGGEVANLLSEAKLRSSSRRVRRVSFT